MPKRLPPKKDILPVGQILRWSGRSDRGRVRVNNEDSFVGVRFDARDVQILGRFGEASTEEADLVFAVSDGMGGAKAGEFASRIAVDKITTRLPRSFKHSAVGLDAGFADVLTELFDDIHRALCFVGTSYEECEGMEATMSLCWFRPGWMYFAHIGDSRIYYLPAAGGPIKQISHDDTHVGWLYRQGQINEREARSHPRRKVLQKALGGGNQFVEPQIGAVGCETGDIFLLCSDGLVEGLHNEQLTDRLRQLGAEWTGLDAAHQLVEEAIRNDGSDNTTALIARIG